MVFLKFLAAGIGAVAASFVQLSSTERKAQCKKNQCVFDPDTFKEFKLITSRYETHDTRRFFFALPEGVDFMHLPVSSCIVLKYTDKDGKDVIRPYTPISGDDVKGRFELLIKRYPKSKMGNYVFTMKPGEGLEMKGPFVKFRYSPNMKRRIGMIAGGTGITPIYQVIREVIQNPKDKTKVDLLYGNNARKDILLANELCEMQKTYPNFHMYLTLIDPPKRWLGGIGLVNKNMVETFMPKPTDKDSMILVCGPPPMMKAISGDKEFKKNSPPAQGEIGGLLKEMGYSIDQVYKF